MFALSVALVALSGRVGELVETTRNLELKLDVIEAFEHGPVILEVTLTNRGKKPIPTDWVFGENKSSIVPPVAWKAWSPPLSQFFGGRGLNSRMLEPGQSLTERHRLHLDYFSTFPAGKYEVEVSWVVHGRGNVGEFTPVIAILTKTFPITVTPATPANRLALARRLKAEFAALPPDAKGEFDDPLYVLGEKLRNTPHKELIPLALEIMKRVEHNPESWELRRLMAEVVFRADPVAAHKLFVDRLLTNSPHKSALETFAIWQWAMHFYRDPVQAYIERIHDQPREEMVADLDSYWFNPMTWEHLWPGEEVWAFLMWANFSAPRILPANELKRLATAKDFIVRAYTYSAFGHRLEAAWSDEFLKEAGRYAQAKPDPKATDPEQSPLYALVKYLDADEPHERKLLDIFAAGRKENPLTKVAREVLDRYEKQK